MTLKIYSFGGGQMVEAMLRAALKKGVITPKTAGVTDISSDRVNYLTDTYHIQASQRPIGRPLRMLTLLFWECVHKITGKKS